MSETLLVYKTYQNCPKEDEIEVMGPDSKHVCLISKDGDRFAVLREHAMKSPQLAGMMTGPGSAEEGEVNEINLTDISTHYLKIVCEHLWYHGCLSGLSAKMLCQILKFFRKKT